jgi:DivIVA domain-containing protein
MDRDQPDERIGELQCQLGEQDRVTAQRCSTAADIRRVSFSRQSTGTPGYNPFEVDALLELVEARLLGSGNLHLTADDIAHLSFSRGSVRAHRVTQA